MAAQFLEGKPVAHHVMNQVSERVRALASRGVVPGLATIFVGDDPASAGYVRKKHEACAAAGFRSENVRLPAATRFTACDRNREVVVKDTERRSFPASCPEGGECHVVASRAGAPSGRCRHSVARGA